MKNLREQKMYKVYSQAKNETELENNNRNFQKIPKYLDIEQFIFKYHMGQ